MQEICTLTRIDFDVLENHNPHYFEHLGTFRASEHLTPHGEAAKWLAEQPPVKMYLGYDGQVYPQFKLKTTYTKN